MVIVMELVDIPDCESGSCGFKSRRSPQQIPKEAWQNRYASDCKPDLSECKSRRLLQFNTALAQSGEHLPVTQEVTGSKPVRSAKHAPVAQLVEHMIEDHGRVGSTPTGCTKYASVAEMD